MCSLSYGRQVQQLLAKCTSGSSLHHRIHRSCRCALMYNDRVQSTFIEYSVM